MNFDELIAKAQETLITVKEASYLDALGEANDSIRHTKEQLDEKVRANEERLKDKQLTLNALQEKRKALQEQHDRCIADTEECRQETSLLRQFNNARQEELADINRQLQEKTNHLASLQTQGQQSELDKDTLQLALYRALGVRQVDGEVELTSHDLRETILLNLDDLSPYYRAKHTWETISNQ